MKITLCGSIAFYPEMTEIKNKLETAGHEVKLPPTKIKDGKGNLITVEEYYEIRKSAPASEKWVWDQKSRSINEHFAKEEWADAILVTNFDKKNISGYIGGNTLMEMGVAFFLKKKIYLLNPIPELSYTEEILGMNPIIINGDISKIFALQK